MKSIFRTLAIGGLGLVVAMPALPQNQPKNGSNSRVEDIYILRSVRESRGFPTDFCTKAKTGFETLGGAQDKFTFRSTATRGSDGLMTDANIQKIGDYRACIGLTANPNAYNFYLEGMLGTVPFKGRGECVNAKQPYPESGLTVGRCYADVFDLPKRYVGGQITISYLNSKTTLGAESDPSGYTQTGILTIRLWKRR
jgi:hypothetical protein